MNYYKIKTTFFITLFLLSKVLYCLFFHKRSLIFQILFPVATISRINCRYFIIVYETAWEKRETLPLKFVSEASWGIITVFYALEQLLLILLLFCRKIVLKRAFLSVVCFQNGKYIKRELKSSSNLHSLLRNSFEMLRDTHMVN